MRRYVQAAIDSEIQTRRTPAVVVADPRITVVEGGNVASPAALGEALELLVKWAVRACMRDESAAQEATTDDS